MQVSALGLLLSFRGEEIDHHNTLEEGGKVDSFI